MDIADRSGWRAGSLVIMSSPPVYTHGHHSSVLRSHSRRSIADSAAYLEPHLHAGASLLDIGAGPGSITAEFAARVRQVTATEIGEAELTLSRNYTAERGIENIVFTVQDVHALTLADNSFDIVHAHQILQHVADPVQALREMARVTAPGGIVAARDADYAGFIWYPQLPELDDWLTLYRTAARANAGQPDAGRRLLAWAHAAGLQNVHATASVWNFTSPTDREWWGKMWAERILESALARQLIDSGLADHPRLRGISTAWQLWAESDDGWILLPHGEIIWHKPDNPHHTGSTATTA
jgi:2-polyprenyl-3-methyl-5-hydroxy-6-metoxy-1,4-benzoquinol methylase